MNKLNYATLEASKRLVEAGIVLETEAYWSKYLPVGEWELCECGFSDDSYPAPSMAEVWRALPDGTQMDKDEESRVWCYVDFYNNTTSTEFISINPADAMIGLLIWLKERKNDS